MPCNAVLCCAVQASGPATIYFMGVIMGNEKLGLLQTLKVAVVCTGVGIASYGDISLTVLGFVLQVASIMADATRCCALQKVMQVCGPGGSTRGGGGGARVQPAAAFLLVLRCLQS